VTHDQEEALTMSDRIAVMRGGKVEQLGTPEELYERPRTRFVADFIGTSNLLAGAIESIAGGCAVIRLSSGETCQTAIGADAAVGRPVELSIRPESIVHPRPPTRRGPMSPGRLDAVGHLSRVGNCRIAPTWPTASRSDPRHWVRLSGNILRSTR